MPLSPPIHCAGCHPDIPDILHCPKLLNYVSLERKEGRGEGASEEVGKVV